MAFGTDQINNPTPRWVGLTVKTYSALAGVILAWMLTASFISPHAKEVWGSVIGLSITSIHAIAPLWGIDLNGKTQIPAEDVTEVKTDNINKQ